MLSSPPVASYRIDEVATVSESQPAVTGSHSQKTLLLVAPLQVLVP